MRNNVFCLMLTLAMPAIVAAQEIHYTQFDATPLTVNPAFTGMFDGTARVSAIYRNSDFTLPNYNPRGDFNTLPYIATNISADMPVLALHDGCYLAAGIQVSRDQTKYNELANFSSIASVAFHKLFGSDTSYSKHHSDLAIGLQAGFLQYAYGFNLSDIYFNRKFVANNYYIVIGNSLIYYPLNVGLSFSRAVCPKFNYTIGISANNINQPTDKTLRKYYELTGIDKRYTGEVGANWTVTDRLELRPAIIYINHSFYYDYIAGSEFKYNVAKQAGTLRSAASVFIGGWYRTGNAVMITSGVEMWRFRLGVAYDYVLNANYGVDIMLRYTMSGSKKSSRRKPVPCNRF